MDINIESKLFFILDENLRLLRSCLPDFGDLAFYVSTHTSINSTADLLETGRYRAAVISFMYAHTSVDDLKYQVGIFVLNLYIKVFNWEK